MCPAGALAPLGEGSWGQMCSPVPGAPEAALLAFSRRSPGWGTGPLTQGVSRLAVSPSLPFGSPVCFYFAFRAT